MNTLLNPTPKQYVRQAAGNARFAWNWAVAIMRHARAEQLVDYRIGIAPVCIG